MLGLTLAVVTATGLAGDWVVDLRPTPESAAYNKPMTLTAAPDGALSGSFYGYPFTGGRAATSNGRQCFAFATADQAGPYAHSGCLAADGSIEGLSWAEGRKLLLAWRAVRATR